MKTEKMIQQADPISTRKQLEAEIASAAAVYVWVNLTETEGAHLKIQKTALLKGIKRAAERDDISSLDEVWVVHKGLYGSLYVG